LVEWRPVTDASLSIALSELSLFKEPTGFAVPWWPAWVAALVATFLLAFAREPTRLRRILGLTLLALLLLAYLLLVFFYNGCVESSTDGAVCDLSSAFVLLDILILLGMAPLVGGALWATRR
jgi:hypothetical protein